MSAAKPLTSDSIIGDNEVWRWDYDGSPRFYLVRIYPQDFGTLKIRAELEGDPTAYAIAFCPDHPSDINEATLDCVGQIEDLMSETWDRESEEGRRDQLTNYERSFGF